MNKRIKYKSNIECQIHNGKLKEWGYETTKILWKDSKGVDHTYNPDFSHPNGSRFIEVKGRWQKGDRTKYKLVKDQNPDFEIIFAFQDPNRTFNKKTTYAEWCNTNGFRFMKWQDLYDL